MSTVGHHATATEPRACLPRILLVHDTHAFGGLEIALLRLIDGLRDRFDFTVLVQNGSLPETTSPGRLIDELTQRDVPTLAYDPSPDGRLSGLTTIWELRSLIRTGGFGLVNIHSSRVSGARQTQLAAALARVPLVRTEHNSPSAFSAPDFGGRVQPLLDRAAARITTVSAGDRQEQIDLVGRPPSKLVVIPNGVDTDHFRPETSIADPALDIGIDAAALVVGAMGRFHPQKGFDLLIAAHARAVERVPHHLVILGDGDEADGLRRQIDELGVSGSVHLLELVHDPRSWMTRFDVAVMPSRHEGLSLLFLEYLAMERALITSDHPSFAEVGAYGQTHRGVPLDPPSALVDAIVDLLERPDERARFGREARRHVVAEHRLAATVDGYAALYRELGSFDAPERGRPQADT